MAQSLKVGDTLPSSSFGTWDNSNRGGSSIFHKDMNAMGFTTSSNQAKEALQRSPFPALRCLQVEVNGQDMILRGRLPSYYQKQVAQETIIPFLQGRKLRNLVQVMRYPVQTV